MKEIKEANNLLAQGARAHEDKAREWERAFKAEKDNNRAKLQEALETLGTLTHTMQEKENQSKLRLKQLG